MSQRPGRVRAALIGRVIEDVAIGHSNGHVSQLEIYFFDGSQLIITPGSCEETDTELNFRFRLFRNREAHDL